MIECVAGEMYSRVALLPGPLFFLQTLKLQREYKACVLQYVTCHNSTFFSYGCADVWHKSVRMLCTGSDSEDLSRQPSSMVDGFENYNDDNGSDSGLPSKSGRSSETSGGEPAS